MSSQNNSSPLIPASQSLPEITLKGILLSIVLTVILASANTYLGLKVGMTISASIPASIIALGALRLFRRHNVLESNIVQTAASSGEALAAGTIFTLPALLIVHFWLGFHYWESVALILTGGILGVFFSIPLRRILLKDKTLRFPEGVAIGNVLKVSARANSDLKYLVYGGLVGAIISFSQSGIMILSDAATFWFKGFGTVFGFGTGFDAAVIGAGYIVGIEVGISILAGVILGWFVGVPILGWIYGVAANQSAAQIASQFWSEYIRYIGVGAMLTGGLWTLCKMSRPLLVGLQASFQAIRSDTPQSFNKIPRTERDLPMMYIVWGVIFVAVVILALFLHFIGYNPLGLSTGMYWIIALVNVVFVLTVGFVLAAICGNLAGLVGSSNSPVSGLILAAVILISFILLLLVQTQVNISGNKLEIDRTVALAIVVVILCATAAAIANDNLQDLKAGQIVGATPWKQQVMLMFGVTIAAFIIPPILDLLFNAYGMGGVYPHHNMDSQQMLAAPQATLVASIARGIIGQNLSWTMIIVGTVIAVVIICLDEWMLRHHKYRVPVLAVGVGIYLPVSASVPIIFGALVSYFVNRTHKKKEVAATSVEKVKIHSLKQRGLVLASGLVAGAAIMGIFMAIPTVITRSSRALSIVSRSFQPSADILSVCVTIALCYWIYRATTRVSR